MENLWPGRAPAPYNVDSDSGARSPQHLLSEILSERTKTVSGYVCRLKRLCKTAWFWTSWFISGRQFWINRKGRTLYYIFLDSACHSRRDHIGPSGACRFAADSWDDKRNSDDLQSGSGSYRELSADSGTYIIRRFLFGSTDPVYAERHGSAVSALYHTKTDCRSGSQSVRCLIYACILKGFISGCIHIR